MIQKHLFSTTLIFFVKENSSLPFLQSRQRRDNLLPGLGGDCQGNYTGIAEKKLSG
jgi:hypothetical protein